MEVNLIWAEAKDFENNTGVIGFEGKIPWHLPEDLAHFKATTEGSPVIMGRKTYDSLPKKPLPNRKNIVITRNKTYLSDSHARPAPSPAPDPAPDPDQRPTHSPAPSPAPGAEHSPAPGAKQPFITQSPEQALKLAETFSDVVWVIGGLEIYKAFLPIANKIVVTKVDLQTSADTYMPVLGSEWKLDEKSACKMSKSGIPYIIELYSNHNTSI